MFKRLRNWWRARRHRGDLYSYKGNIYKVLFEVQLKHPVTGEWIEAYMYQSFKDSTVYVRESADFRSKFNKIPY